MSKIDELRSVKISEWLADGVRLVGSFTLPERMAVVNGKYCVISSTGNVLYQIDIMGSPIGSCGFCGYMPLYNHYTIKNKRTGEEINVGSECMADIFGKDKGERLKKAIESIRRKVSSDFRRPIKQAQLNEWLGNIHIEATTKRNERIDSELAKFPHLYYGNPPMCILPENTVKLIDEGKKRFTSGVGKNEVFDYQNWIEWAYGEVWDIIPHKKFNDQQAILKQQAERTETKDRSFWNYMANNFSLKDWNPETMKKEFKIQAEKDGIEFNLTWRTLTPEERAEESNLIDKQVNDWIAKVSNR